MSKSRDKGLPYGTHFIKGGSIFTKQNLFACGLGPLPRRYIPATSHHLPSTRCRAAGTDVDVEHGIKPEKIDAAQRRVPARASGRVTFLQHCILYATRYQSRAAAHNLHEHNYKDACDNMSHWHLARNLLVLNGLWHFCNTVSYMSLDTRD